MNKLMPWYVALAVSTLMGMVFWSYATWLPIRVFDVFLMAGMSVSAIGIIRGYFKINAIFDRMDKS